MIALEDQGGGTGIRPVAVAAVGVVAFGALIYLFFMFLVWIFEGLRGLLGGSSQGTPLSLVFLTLPPILTILFTRLRS